MKKIFFILVSAFIVSSCGMLNDTSGRSNYDEDVVYRSSNVNFNRFYHTLSPYGTWMNYPGIGDVWIHNDPFFRPYYTNGRWAYSSYGWTWVSNYNWGWAPFHYGRWAHDPFYGWMWVPGYQWGPAWVNWGHYNGYYGWNPMGPSNYNSPANWYFVSEDKLSDAKWQDFAVTGTKAIEFADQAIPITNKKQDYFVGPDISKLERVMDKPIEKVRVQSVREIPLDREIKRNEVVNDMPFEKRRPQVNPIDRAPVREMPVERNLPIDRQRPTQQPVRPTPQPRVLPQQQRFPEVSPTPKSQPLPSDRVPQRRF